MTYEVNYPKVDTTFKVCPDCGYQDGFHSMFDKAGEGGYSWRFICPSCHRVYDIGLKVQINQR